MVSFQGRPGGREPVRLRLSTPRYRRLCALVGESDDLDVKSSALLLINQLVRSAPDKKAKEKLMFKLTRRLGLDRLLSSQLHRSTWETRLSIKTSSAWHHGPVGGRLLLLGCSPRPQGAAEP